MVGKGGSDWEAGEVVPCYDGHSLVNLAAELEIRLTGRSPTRGLRPPSSPRTGVLGGQ